MAIFCQQWVVPWPAWTILQVVLYWAISFWLVSKIMYRRCASNVRSLTSDGKALLRLIAEVTQGLATITILWLCLYQYRPLPPGWFRFSLKGKWHLDVILGCIMFPLITQLARFNHSLRPPQRWRWRWPSPSTARIIYPMVEPSVKEKVLQVMKSSVCAPLWEEILFRGFLLASLTRYMPVWCAILVSSVVFAIVHLNSRMILPHAFFGMIVGATFSRSTNLLPPMLLHSLYNIFVFLGLFK